MHRLVQDLRYAVRMLLRTPGFTAAAVVCLALGIGATTAIFSIVNTVLLRPLPYKQSDRLVRVYSEFPTFPNGGLRRFWISAPEFLDLRKYATSFATLDAWVSGGANLTGGVQPIRVTGSSVSGGLLQSLGVAPLRGRLINPQDDLPTSPQTAVISYGLWQRAFGGDPGVLNRDVLLNGRKCTVVGIMPKGFEFPPGEVAPPELWTPLQIDPAKPGPRGGHFLYLLGRLKPGATVDRARSEASQLVRYWGSTRAPHTHGFDPKNHTIVMFGFHDEVVRGVRRALLMLLGAVAFVLLIACVNVASLLLARAEARQREIAIRRALGAERGQLVRQFVTEGIVLSLAGALAGLALASTAIRIVATTSAASIPRANELGINLTVLAFTVVVSFAAGVAFGLAPLAHIVAKNVHDTLKATATRTTGTVSSQRFRQVLVAGELALALVLLIGTGLMIRAFWKLQQVDTGINASNTLKMTIALPQAVYKDNQRAVQFWTNLQQRVTAMPGVISASMMTGLPPIRPVNANDTDIEGFVKRPNGPLQNIDYYNIVGARYFETMGIRLIEGRLFDERDGENAPRTVIVNETLARIYWPGESAIGHRMRPSGAKDWATIVGVVGDVKNAGLDKPTGTELYIPVRQGPDSFGSVGNLVVRTRNDPRSLVSSIRGQIRDIDPMLPVSNVETMDDVLLKAEARPRFLTTLLTAFAAVALALAAVGIYGVISYSVAQRTSEFGIRIAMGASAPAVLRMVLGQGARLALVGFAIGAVGALLLTRFLKPLLFGVSAEDPLTFLAMVVVLGLVTLAACYAPARRATKVDPMVALRYE